MEKTETQKSKYQKIAESVLSTEIALDKLHNAKFAIKNRKLKREIAKLIKKLETLEKNEFDKIFEHSPQAASDLYGIQDEMIKNIASLGLSHYYNINKMLTKYKKEIENGNKKDKSLQHRRTKGRD